MTDPPESPQPESPPLEPQPPESPPPEPEPSFADYPFRPSILEAIEAAGFETPTPIQAKCMGPVLEGKDIIGLAQTGTGKTAAFALPIIERLGQKLELGAVVLSPTRELAQQLGAMFAQLGATSGIRVATVVGGLPIDDAINALRSWPNVLVATPGRLIDHIRLGTAHFDDVEILVVDEADRMHDMGFIPQIRAIIDALPSERQTLMFSATMPPDVERIARRHMKDPVTVAAGRRSAPAERAQQQLFRTSDRDKPALLLHLLAAGEGRALVFLRTKLAVDRVARGVRRHGHNAVRIHSGRSQADRMDAMEGFRSGKYRILIATDVAARGLDIADIEHVINYDFPHHPEDYVHRIGRTARVAASGLATSFVTRLDRHHLARVERLVAAKLPLQPSPTAPDAADHEDERPTTHAKRPRSRRSGSRRRGGRRAKGSQRNASPASDG